MTRPPRAWARVPGEPTYGSRIFPAPQILPAMRASQAPECRRARPANALRRRSARRLMPAAAREHVEEAGEEAARRGLGQAIEAERSLEADRNRERRRCDDRAVEVASVVAAVLVHHRVDHHLAVQRTCLAVEVPALPDYPLGVLGTRLVLDRVVEGVVSGDDGRHVRDVA